MELSKKLNCADEYVELSRTDPSKSLTIKQDNVTRGGKLIYYGE